MKLSTRLLTTIASTGILAVVPSLGAHATAEWTFFTDAPGVQGSYIDGAIVENFDDGCGSPWAMGALTDGACSSVNGDAYGGASIENGDPTFGGVASPYGAFGPNYSENRTSITLELDSPADYFGIWWTAGDRCNAIEFYSEGTLLSTFTFARLMDLLDSGTFNGINGTDYDSSEYFGSPVNGLYQAEPFAYLHAFAPDGVTFDQITFTHEPECGGFEFDNVAVASGVESVDVDTRLVSLQEEDLASEDSDGLADTGLSNGSAPLLVGALAAVAGITGVIWRRRGHATRR